MELNNDAWEQMDNEYKQMILNAEPVYKSFVQRAGLGVMEVLHEENK